jgi:tetratricopeptide (TPR) repeat protein
MQSHSLEADMLSRTLSVTDSGLPFVERAMALNPNLATAWLLSGWLRAFRGDSDVAIEHFEHAMRLSPLDPELFRMRAGMGFAHLLAGRFDDASSWAEKAFYDLTTFLPAVSIIAASNALAGRMEQARRAMEHLHQLDPALRVDNLTNWFPLRSMNLAGNWAKNSPPRGFGEMVRRITKSGVTRIERHTL